jgi:hypothetical protein
MKIMKISTILLLTLFVLTTSAQSIKQQDLLGKWSSVEPKNPMTLIFKPNNEVLITDNTKSADTLLYKLNFVHGENILIFHTDINGVAIFSTFFKLKFQNQMEINLLAFKVSGIDPITNEFHEENTDSAIALVFRHK